MNILDIISGKHSNVPLFHIVWISDDKTLFITWNTSVTFQVFCMDSGGTFYETYAWTEGDSVRDYDHACKLAAYVSDRLDEVGQHE